jgi:acyl carrier protein
MRSLSFNEALAMSDLEIRDAIKQALVKVAQVDANAIEADTSFQTDLGLDSLAILETIVELELRFQITEANVDDYPSIRTVGAAVRYIRDHLCAVAT